MVVEGRVVRDRVAPKYPTELPLALKNCPSLAEKKERKSTYTPEGPLDGPAVWPRPNGTASNTVGCLGVRNTWNWAGCYIP